MLSVELENQKPEISNPEFADSLPELLLKLQTISENLRDENILTLCQLDKEGFLIGKDETLEEYKTRLDKIFNDIRELEQQLKDDNCFIVYGKLGIKNSDRIGKELCEEAKQIVSTKYAFEPSLIQSFYAPKNFGVFVGGCAISFDSGLSVILLRNVFKLKKKWLLYTSAELLAHELCHSARTPIKDNKLEEFFAYNISISPLRRYLGNCFRSQWDSILILAPILLLLAVTMLKAVIYPSINSVFFWILILIYPAFLVIRNHIALNKFNKAKKILTSYLPKKENAMPILFRCSFEEISSIAKIKDNSGFDSFIKKKVQSELRWKVIQSRFVENPLISPLGVL